MKRVGTALMFVLALAFYVRPAVAQTAPERGQLLQQESQQDSNVIATNEQVGATATVIVTPTPRVRAERQRADSQANRPSRADWIRCLQNDACRPRNLFTDDWDRRFGPVNPSIGG